MRVFLIFRGHSHEADVESTATRVILVEKLSRAVGTPIAPDAKFIFRGSILSEQTTLSDAGLRDGANILVQASTVDEVAAVEHHATFRIRDDLTADKRRRRLPRETASRRTGLVGFGEKRFGFGTIKVLEGLPDKGKARAVLQRIATDRAVLAVMKERGWWVVMTTRTCSPGPRAGGQTVVPTQHACSKSAAAPTYRRCPRYHHAMTTPFFISMRLLLQCTSTATQVCPGAVRDVPRRQGRRRPRLRTGAQRQQGWVALSRAERRMMPHWLDSSIDSHRTDHRMLTHCSAGPL